MFEEEDGAGETAIGYTDQFLEAAVAKLDARFGPGFARDNPALIAAYISTCSANLSAFMQSAMAVASMSEPGIFDEVFEGLNDEPRKKKKNR